MPRLEEDIYFKRISNKIKNGTFTPGEKVGTKPLYLPGKNIKDYPMEERTSDICSSLMSHWNCRFSDVPLKARTRSFFISQFQDDDVFKYIKHHLSNFDREFYKDLIASNKYGVILLNNCFRVMPLDYIDEEMCSLAILVANEWSNSDWFFAVAQRKPEALTSDIWHLGARLYAAMDKEGKNEFLEMAPEEVKDADFYLEMCYSTFNCNAECTVNKSRITDSFPEEVITPDFIGEVLFSDLGNVERMGESALETEVTYNPWHGVVTEKAWQIAIRHNGWLIDQIPLNDERVEFFLSLYAKDTPQYIHSFKNKYKDYLAKKNDPEGYERKMQRIDDSQRALCTLGLEGSLAFASVGMDPMNAIEAISDLTKTDSLLFLPIKYHGQIPTEYTKSHDSEEYLAMIYKALGIEIVEEHDDLFYRATLPDGWTLVSADNDYCLYDENGVCILTYYYYTKMWEKDAYVKEIEVDINLSDDTPRKRKYRLKKEDQ